MTEKTVDLGKTLYEITAQYPELIEILFGLGLAGVKNPVMRETHGKVMTVKEICGNLGLDFEQVVAALRAKGFTVIMTAGTKHDPKDQSAKPGAGWPRRLRIWLLVLGFPITLFGWYVLIAYQPHEGFGLFFTFVGEWFAYPGILAGLAAMYWSCPALPPGASAGATRLAARSVMVAGIVLVVVGVLVALICHTYAI